MKIARSESRAPSSITIVPATIAHADAIDLRPGDAREIEAFGLTPREAMARSLARSVWADAYLVDGQVAALVGLILGSLLSGNAMPWLMTGWPVERHRKAFMELTRAKVRQMLAEHGTLTCNVHAEYTRSIRWLRWLGFEIAPARPYGPKGTLFHEATLRPGLQIRPSSIADLEAAPNIRAILAEYAAEAAIAGLPPPSAQVEAYRTLERVGALTVFSAVRNGDLVGYITVLVSALPHYGVPVAVCESFFVSKPHRKTGAGLRLLRAAEDKARDRGALGLLTSAPTGGDLAKVLPHIGYAETNRVFFKKVTRV